MSTLIFNLKGPELETAIADMEKRVGHVFSNRALLMEALTHPSAASEHQPPIPHNQRLEFLGDAVLQIILSDYLYKAEPAAQEGLLTRLRSLLVKEDATSAYTLALGLDRLLQLGHGECTGGGRMRPSILGDLFEAFLGALYLDAGYAKAEELCLSLLPDTEGLKRKLVLDENPKGALQERCQALRMGIPEYRKLSRSGPVHAPVYAVGIFIRSREIARGEGTSLRAAEKRAAALAWERLANHKEHDMDSTVFALDFDGVICDSARETGLSGWTAARSIWPALFAEERPSEEHIAAFRRVRPFLETGFDSIILNKMLQEKLPFEEFEKNYAAHAERIMRENDLDRASLIARFGGVRDEWIAADLDDWLAQHGFFDGVVDALRTALESGRRVLILTTKQERFVLATLKNQGIEFPPENLYGLERKCKKEVLLADLLRREPGAEIHFVEDRIQTLQRVENVEELESVKLHYADWGYGTRADLAAAGGDPRIDVMTLPRFCSWLAGK